MNIYVDAPTWAIITFNTTLCIWCLFNAYLNFQQLQLMKREAQLKDEQRQEEKDLLR